MISYGYHTMLFYSEKHFHLRAGSELAMRLHAHKSSEAARWRLECLAT